jgi:hypothetical protein
MSFFNQHSFTIAASIALAVFAVIRFRDGISNNDLLTFGALIAGLILAYLLFKPEKSTFDNVSAYEAEIGSGVPVLLEFESNY